MDVKLGFCRIKYKEKYYEFGEILEINDDSILFLGYSPSSIKKTIYFTEIEKLESVKEEDIPPCE